MGPKVLGTHARVEEGLELSPPLVRHFCHAHEICASILSGRNREPLLV